MTTFKDLLPQFPEHPDFRTALTHRSAGNSHNERMEFLGDAVLDTVISKALYLKFVDHDEGLLTRMRASLVCKATLVELAREYQLDKEIILGQSVRRGKDLSKSILANALEAVIGALYLIEGFDSTERFILNIYQDRLARVDTEETKDAKSLLQEYAQAHYKTLPEYELLANDKDKQGASLFTVRCTVDGIDAQASAEASSKSEAEQIAAGLLLQKLNAGKHS